jgi:O-antigen/teichoic acid export membrane protein
MAESYGRRLASSLSGAMLGNVTGFLIGIVTIIAVARLLGPSQYGAYTIAVSFYLLVDAAMSYGLGQYMNKYLTEYSTKGETEKAANTLLLGLLLSFLLGAATMLVGVCAGYLVSGAYKSSGVSFTTLVIASFVILFAVPFGSETSALIGLGKPMRMAVSVIAEYTVQLVASVLLILLGYGFNGAVLGIVTGYGTGFLVGLAFLLNDLSQASLSKLSWQEVKNALAFSLPLGTTNIMNTGVMQLSALLLGIYVASSIIGNYGVATRLNAGIYAMYGAIYTALLSGFSYINARPSENSEAKITKTVTYALVITLPLLTFMSALSKPLVFLLLSNRYKLAPLYLSLASLGLALFLLGRLLATIFTAREKTIKVMKFYLATAIAQLVALLVLIPAWGAIGAVVAIFIVGGIVSSFAFAYATEKDLQIRINSKKLAKAYLANILLGVLLLAGNLLKGNLLEIAYGLLVTFLLYPPLLGLLKVVDKEGINDLRRFAESLHAGWAKGLIEYAGKFV